MKILIILSLFISSTYANTHLVFGLKSQKAIQRLKARPVFTLKEKSFLKGSNVDTQVFKVKDKSIDEIKLICPSCKVEKNSQASLNSINKTSDTYEKYQWALENRGEISETWISDIDAYSTQGIAGEDLQLDLKEKDKKIIVAFIDSGVDTEHPDLKDNIYTHPKECSALEDYNTCLNKESDKNICYERYKDFDANGNGYPLDCHGWSISDKSNPLNDLEGNGNINDTNGHGTHIAGIIGAEHNNIGIKGVIQNVILLPIQVAVSSKNQSGDLATDKFAKALLYAIKSKAQVVNMSLGWRFDQDSLLMRQMIELAISKNILVVAAAGNDSHSSPTYPCSYDGVICVASHDTDGKISSFSNFGAHIDISAPGSNILSTWPLNKRSRSFTIDADYEYLSGTSQATPYVSGVLARLLNQGYSAQEAKVKLLKGARNKKQRDSLIKNGNLDYKKSLIAKTDHFISPLNKSPLLINWDKETKSFKLKIKNYGSSSQKVLLDLKAQRSASQGSLKVLKALPKQVSFQAFEEKEFSITLSSDQDIDGTFLFKLSIDNKVYFIQAKSLSLINPENTRDDMQSIELKDVENFLEDSILREFKDYTGSKHKEFLALKDINDNRFIAKMTYINNKYQVSKSLRLPFKDSIIINLSKVDLELDGVADYVITLVNLEDRENRETKFLALDSDFKPKRIFISPKNSFKNDITVLPGSFIWLKHNKRMVPAWITMGETPLKERPVLGPWDTAKPEIRKNRLYLQLEDRLKSIQFPHDEELPLHFLYQNQLKTAGEAMIITSSGFNYDKTYNLYRYSDKLNLVSKINLEKHFDLASSKPLPLVNPIGEHAFFNTPSIDGAQNILSFDYDTDAKKLNIKALKAKGNNQNPIRFVLSVEDSSILSQTSNRLIQQNGQFHVQSFKTESRTDARRIKHTLLRSKQALFLSSALTPGIGSEVVQTLKHVDVLYRPAHFQMLGVSGCSEIGFIFEQGEDRILFSCPSLAKILRIKL